MIVCRVVSDHAQCSNVSHTNARFSQKVLNCIDVPVISDTERGQCQNDRMSIDFFLDTFHQHGVCRKIRRSILLDALFSFPTRLPCCWQLHLDVLPALHNGRRKLLTRTFYTIRYRPTLQQRANVHNVNVVSIRNRFFLRRWSDINRFKISTK